MNVREKLLGLLEALERTTTEEREAEATMELGRELTLDEMLLVRGGYPFPSTCGYPNPTDDDCSPVILV